jgi:hypothetical protein
MGFEDEYAGKGKAESKGVRPFLPIMGLVLMIAFGAIAFVVSPNAVLLAQNNLEGFDGGCFQTATGVDCDPEQVGIRLIFAGLIFVVLMGFAGFFLALASPKPKTDKLATEKQLKKEKAERQKERQAQKKRKQEINRKVAKERKDKLGQ